ncbi:hypothetical protein CLOM_g21227 [Closterium sp. NIES-68]|nr:hypothetical protein CLOM_g21227 [Closterium sp. NIES-68]
MADSSAVSSANAGHMAPLPEDLTEAGQKLLSDVQGVMERCKALQETARVTASASRARATRSASARSRSRRSCACCERALTSQRRKTRFRLKSRSRWTRTWCEPGAWCTKGILAALLPPQGERLLPVAVPGPCERAVFSEGRAVQSQGGVQQLPGSHSSHLPGSAAAAAGGEAVHEPELPAGARRARLSGMAIALLQRASAAGKHSAHQRQRHPTVGRG